MIANADTKINGLLHLCKNNKTFVDSKLLLSVFQSVITLLLQKYGYKNMFFIFISLNPRKENCFNVDIVELKRFFSL